ncbi:MAG: hypothetical protein Q8P97_02480 [bacterium]|nr:hypothetical protein [bacterium]
MERFAAAYVIFRIAHRFTQFFRHWYVRSFILWTHGTLSFLETLDRTFAVRITLRHFGEPLYQDRSIVGYILGFIFRSARIVIGGLLYGVVILGAALLYIIWCAILPYLIYKIFNP